MDAPPPLIPRPVHVRSLPGNSTLPPHTVIACQGEHAPGIARYLAGFLEALGLHVDLQTPGDAAVGGASSETALPNGPRIMLAHEPGSVDALAGLPHADEGYELTVTEAGVGVSALAPHGLFNGVVSLLQLLPAAAPLDGHIVLDCLHVRGPGALLPGRGGIAGSAAAGGACSQGAGSTCLWQSSTQSAVVRLVYCAASPPALAVADVACACFAGRVLRQTNMSLGRTRQCAPLFNIRKR